MRCCAPLVTRWGLGGHHCTPPMSHLLLVGSQLRPPLLFMLTCVCALNFIHNRHHHHHHHRHFHLHYKLGT